VKAEYLQQHRRCRENQGVLVIEAADHERERFAHSGEIGRNVEGVGYHQDGYKRYQQPARGEVFHIGNDAFSCHATDLSADNLDGDHERRCQKNSPQQAITKLRSGLGISRDAGRIVVGGPRDQPGSEQPQYDTRSPSG
jgi:hypothetical protein